MKNNKCEICGNIKVYNDSYGEDICPFCSSIKPRRFSESEIFRNSPDIEKMCNKLIKEFPEVYPSKSQVFRAGVVRLYLEKFNIDRIILDTKRRKDEKQG